jgi:transcription elongation factor Elf1
MQINRCPKCGREPRVDLIQSYLTLDGFVTVECQTCGLKVTCDFESTELAIEKWNRMTKGENNETTKA